MSIVVKVMDKVRRASAEESRRRRLLREQDRASARRGAAAAEDDRAGTGIETAQPAPAPTSVPEEDTRVVQGEEALQTVSPPVRAPADSSDAAVVEEIEASVTEVAAEGANGGPTAGTKEVFDAASAVPSQAAPVVTEAMRVVALDKARLAEEGLLVPAALRERFVRQYRAIKRPLLRNLNKGAMSGSSNLILITSALSDEGKTFTSFNLAMSLATELDRTVLLVDADAAKSRLSRAFGLYDSLGLIDVLENRQLDLNQALVRIEGKPNMTFLPAGTNHNHVTELFASVRMKQLVEEIACRYDDRIVLFDSPPMLAASEVTVLASLIGQIVFVIKANETPQHAVKEALKKLDEDKAIGLVLNKCNVASESEFYGSPYGY